MASPTIQVLLDDGTGSFPFDISRYVLAGDGLQVTCGRDDWQGAVTAGELTLTLNNSDGRFSPGSTILATPSPIKVDQQIRVIGTGLGFGVGGFGLGGFGGTLPRFTGYVKSWPVAWPAVVSTFSTVQLTATDAQARAERRTLRSMLEEEILPDGPTAYYTLGEAEGSTAAGDTSGNQAQSLNIAGSGAAPTFGASVVADATGVKFAGGQRLDTSHTKTLLGTGAWTLEALVLIASAPVSEQTIARVTSGGILTSTTAQACFNVESTGRVLALTNVNGPGYGLNGPVITDGQPHHLAMTYNGTNTLTLYADGVSVASTALMPPMTVPMARLAVGGGDGPLTGTVASVILTDGTALSGTRIAQHAGAVLTGFAGESGTSRITRLARYAGIPLGSLDTSLTSVPTQDTSGQSAQDAIQAVADAEMGLVFINGSGGLEFHNRAHVSGKTTPDLLLDAQYITADVTPVLDDQRIVNYVETTTAGTGVTSLARNQTSETAHGRYPTSETYLVLTDREALDRANWIITKQAEPSTRYGTLTINLYKMPADQASNVVATVGLDCWLRVTSLGPQNPGGMVANVVVQGFQESGENEAWTLACNVVARSMYDALILDDPTYGALDSQPILN